MTRYFIVVESAVRPETKMRSAYGVRSLTVAARQGYRGRIHLYVAHHVRAATLLLLVQLAGAANERCASCHPAIAASYAKTGMGRSISVPVREAVAEQSWMLPRSNANAAVEWKDGKLIHRAGAESRAMDVAIGSGAAGKSFLWWMEDALFQSPIAWYTEQKRWDLAPGYSHDERPAFYRPITDECLTCHTAGAAAMQGSESRYADRGLQPIGCERCHGRGEAHTKAPARENIVNPARLSNVQRDSVCESCHLSGEARIPNPGRKFAHFQPGMALEEVFTVYVSPAGGPLKVVSHAEQMAASRCALESRGKMWCGSCHDPHREPEPSAKADFFRARCLQCHESAAMKTHEAKSGRDCAGCHMPRSTAYDGGHTAFTDHWIRVRKNDDAKPGAITLRPWRAPAAAYAKRNQALGYVAAAEKRQSIEWMRAAVHALNPLLDQGPDAEIATAAGLLALRQGKALQAVKWFALALKQEGESSRGHANLAAAYLATGERALAASHAKAALRIEPLREEPYAILVEAEPDRAADWRTLYRRRIGR